MTVSKAKLKARGLTREEDALLESISVHVGGILFDLAAPKEGQFPSDYRWNLAKEVQRAVDMVDMGITRQDLTDW